MARPEGSYTKILAKGSVFGRLEVISDIIVEARGNRKRKFYICRCDCGKKLKVREDCLITSNTSSCGCFALERQINTFTKHGMYKHPLYSVHRSMKARCYNSKSQRYTDYGGRGITVCDEWLGETGFQNFKDWNDSLPVEKQWRLGLQIDRRNNNKGYYPKNCRWVTNKKNNTNKRNTKTVTHQGKPIKFKELYEKHKRVVSYNVALYRIRNGWNPLDAITRGKYEKVEKTKG